ncbi:MAG: hypothetical protein FJ280_24520 [Planctomycetes bacterium]|nr:hypothetical protein [Planctomycetota bacterium]
MALSYQCRTLRVALEDLIATFGTRYPKGQEYLQRLDRLEDRPEAEPLEQLRRETLLANPLLDFDKLLLVKRKSLRQMPAVKQKKLKIPNVPGIDLGFPSNHECNSSLPRDGYDNEIAVLSLTSLMWDSRPRLSIEKMTPEGGGPTGRGPHATSDAPGVLRTLYRPAADVYVGEVDLHSDADRLLFTQSGRENWRVWEMRVDGSGLRQVSQTPGDVDSFDACYLPDGRIVFGSTACWQAVPCWHGQKIVTNLYTMNADGSGMRQVCFDQDHNFHPVVLNNGQVLFHRWDYTGINHIFLRQLMVMNPDGTGQRAVYGVNSWYPNSLYFPRPLPGNSERLICILSGYHGVHKMGQLVLVDTDRGWHEADGLIQRISGRGQPIEPKVVDELVDKDWPKFLHPYPLSDKYFLVACWPNAQASWGIYLADVFDNLLLIREEPGYALLEPVPLMKRPKPPVLADRVDLARKDGVVYLHNVYSGPGLAGVPRGHIKSLRIIAYHFGYPGLAGPDIVGFGGPWEVMRILGTVPLEEDGSVMFRVPANTPVAVQTLDAEGKAVQLMRSWFTVMPGETLSCVGCHERPTDVSPSQVALAAVRDVREIQPWHGPARGFDFRREVQPVLNRHCVACHDGRADRPDLRPRERVPEYKGRRLSKLGVQRMHPEMLADTGGVLKYAPAYDALIPYIRRVSIEDDVSMLVPGEYHADTSELIQMLRKGHQGVHLDPQAWDRLVTWIDLNGPCHGTWGDAYPIPDGAHERRMALRQAYGGPQDDPEAVPATPRYDETPVAPTDASLVAGGPWPVARDPGHESPVTSREPVGWGLPHHESQGTGAGGASPTLQARVEGVPPSERGHDAIPAHAGDADATKSERQSLLRAKRGDARDTAERSERTIDLGGGVTLRLVQIPAGQFVIGDAHGEPDERPLARVAIDQPFWMGAGEVTNEQFRRFDPRHDSRYYQKRHARSDDQGVPLDEPEQPVVRVSYEQAAAFCRWLSQRTGLRFTLPTEAQWEYACRAGTATPLHYGDLDTDFSSWANLGDLSFGDAEKGNYVGLTGGLEHVVLEGSALSDRRFDDGFVVTAPVGRFRPNAWGLHDMHGNAAEWTATTYRTYGTDGTCGLDSEPVRKVVRGGSFFDRPARARSAFRLAYPPWQRVFNVGFRVVCEPTDPLTHAPPRPVAEERR